MRPGLRQCHARSDHHAWRRSLGRLLHVRRLLPPDQLFIVRAVIHVSKAPLPVQAAVLSQLVATTFCTIDAELPLRASTPCEGLSAGRYVLAVSTHNPTFTPAAEPPNSGRSFSPPMLLGAPSVPFPPAARCGKRTMRSTRPGGTAHATSLRQSSATCRLRRPRPRGTRAARRRREKLSQRFA